MVINHPRGVILEKLLLVITTNKIHPMTAKIEIMSVIRFIPLDLFAIGIHPLLDET